MISIETKGRLGNQFFQYATCRSIAEKNGYNYYISVHPMWNQILRFNLPMGKIDGSIKRTMTDDYYLKYLHINNDLPYDYWNILDYTFLIGYYQRSEFFDFNYDNIQKWFDVTNLIDKNQYLQLYNKYENYCFMHIRGTDFKEIKQYIVPKEYYIKSMNLILEIDKDVKFVIITDDIEYSKKLFPDIDCLCSSDHLIDFKLLQSSKYLISSNSTFSWWAGYLNTTSKKIIYPYGGLSLGNDTQYFSKCNRFFYI